jgi:2'-hydroxyisoflavone reductase
MRLLCIGGTRFAGRFTAEAALAAGHEVTLFHRGKTGADLFPEAEHVLGDRATDLHLLDGRSFDAVLDFCGYFPAKVRASAEVLAGSGWYGFVSSVSAHPLPLPAGSDEDAPLHEPLLSGEEVITGDSYGPLKVACEQEVKRIFAGRSAVVRPGYIVGPYDPTDRFPSLVRRAAAGGEMLVPGAPSDALQFVDARDLAAFLLRLADGHVDGSFTAVHPRHTATMGQVLAAAGGDTAVTWVDGDWFVAACPEEERERAFPMWAPEYEGFHQLDSRRAAAAGLPTRPVAETVADTVAWERGCGRAPTMGLPAEREQELLTAWRHRAAGQ